MQKVNNLKAALLVLIAIAIHGCATISSDYTPAPLDLSKLQVDVKQDVSFSIEIISEIGRFNIIEKEDLVLIIKENLKATKLYKKIAYAPFDKKSNNHLHFQFVISGTKESQAAGIGFLYGLFFMTIPIFADYYSDMSVFLIKSDEEKFSASATEKINKIYWLPFILISPVFNDYVTANKVVSEQIHYLVSKVANNHLESQSYPK